MNAPFFKFDMFSVDFSLVIAFVIGIGFGFALERGGFGSAKILASQFYFTDMRVLKVMFSAIVTAMLGLFFFVAFGWLDLSLVYYTDTNLVPQIVGGLILGVGFVVGGYCPGTSCVSASTGRIDAVVYLFGVISGVLAFGEIFPWISDFYYSSNMGKVFLPDYLGLSYGMVVFLVVLMAVGAFGAAEWGERKMVAKKSGGSK